MTKQDIHKIRKCVGVYDKLIKYLEIKGLLYKRPEAETLKGWRSWKSKVKAQYPIQYFIRESFDSVKYSIAHRFTTIKYYVRTFLFPENQTIRKTIPKRGHDLASLIPLMNFAAITQFKEEADKSCVDWDAHEEHREFKQWLDASALWIQEGKDRLEKELSAAYPEIDIDKIFSGEVINYEETYREVNRIEALIAQTEEDILLQMVKYRNYFWT
jgi:hypothetical protein